MRSAAGKLLVDPWGPGMGLGEPEPEAATSAGASSSDQRGRAAESLEKG